MFSHVRRSYQKVNGVLLLDKPIGLSSNGALQKVRRAFGAAKAGHTGTLDPFATGLLVCCFGEATKFSDDLLNADKTYDAVMQLGFETTTGDTEGEVVEFTTEQVEALLALKALDTLAVKEHVLKIFGQFVGLINQHPPMYSALKHQGKPLYEYARNGLEIHRETRAINIYSLSVNFISLPQIGFRVRCSKGTYIRTLAQDIGRALGVGAHLTELRRLAIADLDLSKAYQLAVIEATESEQNLAPNCLYPVDYLISALPLVNLNSELSMRFMQGQRILSNQLSVSVQTLGVSPANPTMRCRIQDQAQAFLGTAQLSEWVLRPERLINKNP